MTKPHVIKIIADTNSHQIILRGPYNTWLEKLDLRNSEDCEREICCKDTDCIFSAINEAGLVDEWRHKKMTKDFMQKIKYDVICIIDRLRVDQKLLYTDWTVECEMTND